MRWLKHTFALRNDPGPSAMTGKRPLIFVTNQKKPKRHVPIKQQPKFLPQNLRSALRILSLP